MSYFICRRAFRDAEGPVPVGSVVDPTGIKRFRFRLQEKHIVEVTEHNFEQYATLFEQRYGITIPKLDELPLVESDEENAEVDTEENAEVDTEEIAEVDTEENAEVKESPKAKAKPKPTVAKATAKAKVTENK